ncbi:hypothetical protein K469DRAFT_694352 [Zopfia rhizophila CBS 207.26]|uniref:Uncharacterized protein n=1 Tax=Zopfia rhizophila CBS 207.26 TaxID=1314779 RepID=A0A6A6EJB6_9PEZI|nr:hypothetical protein K469DRAFT_694352 [Zopfia rhizophila CBS 207.26]
MLDGRRCLAHSGSPGLLDDQNHQRFTLMDARTPTYYGPDANSPCTMKMTRFSTSHSEGLENVSASWDYDLANGRYMDWQLQSLDETLNDPVSARSLVDPLSSSTVVEIPRFPPRWGAVESIHQASHRQVHHNNDDLSWSLVGVLADPCLVGTDMDLASTSHGYSGLKRPLGNHSLGIADPPFTCESYVSTFMPWNHVTLAQVDHFKPTVESVFNSQHLSVNTLHGVQDSTTTTTNFATDEYLVVNVGDLLPVLAPSDSTIIANQRISQTRHQKFDLDFPHLPRHVERIGIS